MAQKGLWEPVSKKASMILHITSHFCIRVYQTFFKYIQEKGHLFPICSMSPLCTFPGELALAFLTSCSSGTHPPPLPKRTPSQGYSVTVFLTLTFLILFIPPFIHVHFYRIIEQCLPVFPCYPLHAHVTFPCPQKMIKGDFDLLHTMVCVFSFSFL